MTVQLSPHKVSKILRDYFRGLPQTKIAKEAGVDQSSISHYASRFKGTAAEYGLLAAGKEYQVFNEVESLRSLSVELYKSKLTAEEALAADTHLAGIVNQDKGRSCSKRSRCLRKIRN